MTGQITGPATAPIDQILIALATEPPDQTSEMEAPPEKREKEEREQSELESVEQSLPSSLVDEIRYQSTHL